MHLSKIPLIKQHNQKNRLQETLIKYGIILSIGGLYYIWISLTDIKFPCPIYKATGYLCPSCGVTRMIVCLLRGDFENAYTYNPFLFITFPLIAGLLIYSEVRYVQIGERTLGMFNGLCWIEIGLAIGYGIIRNIL